MARTFTAASSEDIVTSLGALGFAFGPGTIAAICQRASDAANHCVFRGGSASSSRYDFLVASTDLLRLFLNNSGISASTLKLLAADGWCLIAGTKATGTATPRFHKYQYSNDTHTHENGTSTLANSGTAGTKGTIGSQQSSTAYWNGDLAVIGVWNVVLTDAQIEMLPFNLAAWYAPAQPKGLWVLDQDVVTQKVVDLSGGGATESSRTGTTVSTNSVPVFSYGHPVRRAWRVPGGLSTVSLSGALTPTSTIVEAVANKLLGSLTPAGVANKRAAPAVAGAFTPSGLLADRAGKGLAGALTPTSTLTDRVAQALAGALTPSGTPANSTAKQCAGVLTPASTLATGLLQLLALAGSLVPSGATINRAAHTVAGALTPTAALTSQAAKTLAGALTPTGLIRYGFSLVYVGAVVPAGSLAKAAATELAGALTSAGALTASAAQQFTVAAAGIITPAGDLAKTAGAALIGTLTPAGAIAERAITFALAGVLTPAGAAAKQATKRFISTLTPDGFVAVPRLIAGLIQIGTLTIAAVGGFFRSRPGRLDTTHTAQITHGTDGDIADTDEGDIT